MYKFPDHAEFYTSSYSGARGSNCIQYTSLPEGRHGVRDSKNPDLGGHLFVHGEWLAFLEAIKSGGLDV